jgi:Domain of unknown function (DUF4406)
MSKILVYIAGPVSLGDLDQNVRQANEAMIELMKAGFAPFNPMLSCFAGWPEAKGPEVLPRNTVHDDWYDMDLSWVSVCQAVLRLPGESKGADREVAHANALNIPVFRTAGELGAFFRR